jgi:hypothetical protein
LIPPTQSIFFSTRNSTIINHAGVNNDDFGDAMEDYIRPEMLTEDGGNRRLDRMGVNELTRDGNEGSVSGEGGGIVYGQGE